MADETPASTNGSFNVLVVEDEADIAAVVAYQLTRAGYGVRTAQTGSEALRLIDVDPPDLLILDLMLPEMDGLDLLRQLRDSEETRSLPVLILTARSEEEYRVRGLELGADDYVSKPFSPRELVLRVSALLRRTGSTDTSQQRLKMRAGPIEVDVNGHRVMVEGREVKLTRKEFRLLTVLMRRRGRTQTREALLEAVWDTTAAIETRTVDMHVRRLRKKLGPQADLVETVRGFGYRLKADG